MRSEKAPGFTLIEVLVVLLITALVASLLLQGFGQILDLRVRYLDLARRQSVDFLEQHWFASLVHGVVPDFSNGKEQFEGDGDELSGLTLSPLYGYVGGPSSFSLELRREDDRQVLFYLDEGLEDPVDLVHFQADTARFVYMGADMRTHRFWPPMGRQSNSVPHAIMVQLRQGGDDFFWAARVDSRRNDWDDRLPQRLGTGF